MSPLHVLTFDLSTFILDCENYGLSVGLFSLASVTSVEQLNIDQVFFPSIHQGKWGAVPAVLSEKRIMQCHVNLIRCPFCF